MKIITLDFLKYAFFTYLVQWKYVLAMRSAENEVENSKNRSIQVDVQDIRR